MRLMEALAALQDAGASEGVRLLAFKAMAYLDVPGLFEGYYRDLAKGDPVPSLHLLLYGPQFDRLVLRLLDQESSHPVLKPVFDQGRRGHREWLATVFDAALKPLTPAKRKAKLDALVVATDLYIWKLVRRDMGRPVAAFKAIVTTMLNAALASE